MDAHISVTGKSCRLCATIPVVDKREMTGGGNGTGNTSPPPPYESIANVQVRVFRNVAPFWGAGMLHGA